MLGVDPRHELVRCRRNKKLFLSQCELRLLDFVFVQTSWSCLLEQSVVGTLGEPFGAVERVAFPCEPGVLSSTGSCSLENPPKCQPQVLTWPANRVFAYDLPREAVMSIGSISKTRSRTLTAYRTPVAVARVQAPKMPRMTPRSPFVILPLCDIADEEYLTGVVSLGPMVTIRRVRT